ncbi:MAG: hypothetical protein IPJ85_01840 [Flavobacteriales bacterium]|nr:hypothetical protein [Flavobacteriales bacterium]
MHQAIKNPVLRFMVHGHLVLALGAALQVWWIGEHWFGQGSWYKSAAAFFATIACYGYNRLMRSRDADLSEVAFFYWYRRHAKLMWAVAIASVVIVLGLIAPELPVLIERLGVVVIPALLYVTPLRTKTGHVIGLRHVPGLKSLLVAWVWAAGTVLLAADEVTGLDWLLVIVLLSFYWSIAIAFDLRDASVDASGLRTFPQLFGVRVSKFIAGLLLIPLAYMLVGMYVIKVNGGRDWSMLVPLLVLLLMVVLIIRSSPQRGWSHWLVLDGCIALIPLLAILGSLC